jgi:serine/threonine-protein kinase
MRTTFNALALAPDHREAQRTLATLLIEVPSELPPEAKDDRDAHRREERRQGAGLGALAFFWYLAVLPLALFAGVKSWPTVVFATVVTLSAGFTARWVHRTGAVGTPSFVALLLFSVAVVMVQATWLGPFVLLPTSAALTITAFAMYGSKREQVPVLIAGALMFLVPFTLDVLGVVPPGFSFEPGRVVLHERALGLPKVVTLIALAYTCTTFIVLPGAYIGRATRAMRAIEDRQFLQSWYLKRAFPATADA